MGPPPGCVVLEGIRKQVEQDLRDKPVSTLLYGLCISSHLQVFALPSLTSRMMHYELGDKINPLPLKLLLLMVFYHSKNILTKMAVQ